MNNKMIISLVIICTLINLTACDKPKSIDYFPFDEGMIKEYIVTFSYNDNKSLTKLKCINLALRDLNGASVFPVKVEPYNMVGILIEGVSFYFYGKDDKGVYEYAKQNPADIEPKIYNFQSPYYLIKYPIKINYSWKIGNITLIIEAIDETVTVSSGTFQGCIKIKSVSEHSDIKISWYAPNVGLIKYTTNKGNAVYNGQLSYYKR